MPTNIVVCNEDGSPDPRSGDGTPLMAQQVLSLGNVSFKRSDNATEQLNIDGRSAGDATNLWDGTGADDTGSDWTSSGTGSESADAAHSGTNGWDSGSTSQNDTTLFNYGSDITIEGVFSELSFWLNVQAFPQGSSLRVAFLDGSNGIVGNALKVEDYVTNQDLDVWQKVGIPIADFALGGDVQKLALQYRNTDGQQHYLDDIALVEPGGGGPYTFQVSPPDGDESIYHLTMLVLLLSGPASGWGSTTFANIAALDNGLLLRHRRLSTAEVLWKFNSKDNIDLFGRYHPQDVVTFNDGTMLVGFMVKPGSAGVKITNDDVLEFVVRDDLSALTSARAFAHYGVEVV